MASGERTQVSIALSDQATIWYESLTLEARQRVDTRLRALALDPDSAPARSMDASGVVMYSASIEGRRVDFVVDRSMERAEIPAIAVVRAKRLRRR